MTPRSEFRPATAADIEAFYGVPAQKPVRAYVAAVDGVVLGIGGVYRDGEQDVAFCDLKPEMKRHRKLIVAGARLFQREFGSIQVSAVANPAEPGAERFLFRLGFTSYEAWSGKAFVRYA